MVEIVDFEAFKAKKLKRLEDEWAMYMDRAAAFQKEGKQKFADEMVRKAKALRPLIDKLRGPQKKAPPRECSPVIGVNPVWAAVSFEPFQGLSHADMGHRKAPQVTPEPENN